MSNVSITNVSVCGIEDAIISAKFSTDDGELYKNYNDAIYSLKLYIKHMYDNIDDFGIAFYNERWEFGKYLFDLASRLGTSRGGSGHDTFLKGINVSFNIEYPQHFTRQLQRYHFIDYVSSSSTMKSVLILPDKNEEAFRYIDTRIIEIIKEKIQDYNSAPEECKKELFNEIIDNVPMGVMLWARCTTNYLQLKSIYNQRKNHKLYAWNDFTKFIETLPYIKQLALNNVEE